MMMARDLASGAMISLRPRHDQAEADAKRLQLPRFEVVPVEVTIREIPPEEIGALPGSTAAPSRQD